MTYLKKDEEKYLHIEPTTRCTIRCIQCPRTMYNDNITLEDCDIELTVKITLGKKRVFLCGNHGDPIYHPKFHELVTRIREANPKLIFGMHTNGAFRSIDWWKKTANIFDYRDSITFSIDGLPDNNHLYRMDSKWETIENGIKTLVEINPNIKLIWKWIVFKYNQHDIDKGISLAKNLGFHGFKIVNSIRYDQTGILTPTVDWKEIHDRYI